MTDPRILVIDDFLEDTQALIDGASIKPHTQRWKDAERRCSLGWISAAKLGCMDAVRALTPLGTCESIQLCHYGVGQGYPVHMDENASTRADHRRYTTVILYLNTPEAGGATYFPQLDRRVEAKKGRLLLFDTTDPVTHIINPRSEHAGEPVLAGKKWIVTLWFRKPV